MSTGTETGAGRRKLNPAKPPRSGTAWKLAIAALIGFYVVLAGYDLIANPSIFRSGVPKSVSAAPPTATPTVSAANAARQSATASNVPAPASTASAPVHPVHPASRPLGVVSVAAFGPDGIADGDNPGIVSRLLRVRTDQPWFSQWYATPEFGNLKPGTGLLLDMGKPVTVSSVQLTLGSQLGAVMQLRVGDTAALADLSTVAAATDVGGTVRLSVATRATGRYVLIWFTTLPPNGQGEYQVSVYDVTVEGTSGT